MFALTTSRTQPSLAINAHVPRPQTKLISFKATFVGQQPKIQSARLPTYSRHNTKVVAIARPNVSMSSASANIDFFKSQPTFQNHELVKLVKGYVDEKFSQKRTMQPVLNFTEFTKQYPHLRYIDYDSSLGANLDGNI